MNGTLGDATSTLTIPTHCNGPDGSGNGGYSSGLLAARLTAEGGPAVTVTLRTPPPLGRPLTVAGDPATGLLLTDPETDGKGHLVAEAVRAELPDRPAVPGTPATPGEAAEAEKRYPGLEGHPFPRCYSCGPDRPEGDGLHLCPGRVRPGTGPDGAGTVVACTWTPHPGLDGGSGTVALPDTWTALDCPGGWSHDVKGRPIVLGRFTARVQEAPRIGRTYVAMGHLEAVEGRKVHTGSALYDASGRLVAQAHATWIMVAPPTS
ncbi:hypothetical protein [Nocardiopsis sp. CNT312]|uniref:hypothetical protein n=1 Tax=Nocardiopsis sp. CNT312 TaxID=1137268 RepID=UPI00048C3C57|nr:hypothetical protein [Nocardiopsis sp. CNT312]